MAVRSFRMGALRCLHRRGLSNAARVMRAKLLCIQELSASSAQQSGDPAERVHVERARQRRRNRIEGALDAI